MCIIPIYPAMLSILAYEQLGYLKSDQGGDVGQGGHVGERKRGPKPRIRFAFDHRQS